MAFWILRGVPSSLDPCGRCQRGTSLYGRSLCVFPGLEPLTSPLLVSSLSLWPLWHLFSPSTSSDPEPFSSLVLPLVRSRHRFRARGSTLVCRFRLFLSLCPGVAHRQFSGSYPPLFSIRSSCTPAVAPPSPAKIIQAISPTSHIPLPSVPCESVSWFTGVTPVSALPFWYILLGGLDSPCFLGH